MNLMFSKKVDPNFLNIIESYSPWKNEIHMKLLLAKQFDQLEK